MRKIACLFRFVLLISCVGISSTYAQKRITKDKAEKLKAEFLEKSKQAYRPKALEQWSAKQIHADGQTMKFDYKIFGQEPQDGRSLYISLHGGGGAPASLNDQQWKNQIMLYQPKEGVYIAPRAPTNTWNLWHEDHMDSLLVELIKTVIVTTNVNPNKVYIMGYSAGGDGVFQLAPRMAQHWAAASMMAGHPGDADARNLRNLPFAIYMGGADGAYQRNNLAKVWKTKLDSLAAGDPSGYIHEVTIYEGMPHWMGRKDTVALDWMVQYRRNSLPNKINWVQDDRLHEQFYWLAVPKDKEVKGALISAHIEGNTIFLDKAETKQLYIYLNDEMVDLDKPIEVRYGNKTLFHQKVKRDPALINETTERYLDKGLVFSVRLTIDIS